MQKSSPILPATTSSGSSGENGETMPADTGCLLNPMAMTGFVGGTLTLHSQDGDGDWTARWSGAATIASLAESGDGQSDSPPQRQAEAAMLEAADCGRSALIELTRPALHRLVTILNDQPPPPGTEPVTRQRTLTIRVQSPPTP